MANANFQGGDKLSSILKQYEKNLSGDAAVNVGFFAGSTERKSGLPSAFIALMNEYGTDKMPARPFFRFMIRDGQPHWGDDLGQYLVQTKMSGALSLAYMGEQMADELKESIQLQRYAPLKQSTIDKKGHAQTLIDTADMINAVTYQVDT